MKIAVYSVGRTGSKILFLLLSQILIKKFGKAKLLYEPLHWADPRCNTFSKEGLQANLEIPLLADALGYTKPNDFVGSMLSENIPSLVKFTRSGGRAAYLQEQINADKFFILLRDPLDIIDSLSKTRFTLLYPHYHKSIINQIAYPIYGRDSFVSIFQNNLEWKKLLEEIKDLNIDLWNRLKQIDGGKKNFLQRDFVYVTLMVRYLEKTAKSIYSSRLMTLGYRDLVEHSKVTIANICDFLGIQNDDSFEDFIRINSKFIHHPKKLFSSCDFDSNIYGGINYDYLDSNNIVLGKEKPRVKQGYNKEEMSILMKEIDNLLQ